MLSRLSNYIFGGLFGTPEAETTPLRYETREAAGDWLLVDMPDQAIDNESMDSESEEDDILTAIPMLMTENVVTEQPSKVVLTFEEARDNSICDNYNKIQNSCYVDIQDNSDTKILNISDIQGESEYDIYNLNEFPWLFPDDLFSNSSLEVQENYCDKSTDSFSKLRDIFVEVEEKSKDEIQANHRQKILAIPPELENAFRDSLYVKELTSMLSRDEDIFNDDEVLESSDNEVQPNYDEFRYYFNDVFRDNSDAEEEKENSDDEIPEDTVRIYPELASIPRRRKLPMPDTSKTRGRCVQLHRKHGEEILGKKKMLATPFVANFHDYRCLRNPVYEHAANFHILSQTWDSNQTMHSPCNFSRAVGFSYSSTIKFDSPILVPLPTVFQAQTEKKESTEFKPSSTLTERNDHPEYLKHVFKLRDTALKIREAKNTALVLGQVKEIKPVQEAIQYESKKYLTRSHLNRQNKNYFYQSSVKTNRRRNLQRNHSGANNNRRC